jgi:hypothetical protein
MSDVTFEQVKKMIEQMSPDEVEQLRAWLNAPASKPQVTNHEDSTWGANLVRLVQEFPLQEADQMDIEHPEAWVREHRRTKTSKRNPGWGDK